MLAIWLKVNTLIGALEINVGVIMVKQIFISYSHADERWMIQLSKHLAPLQREGVINNWFDRQMFVGSDLDLEVRKELKKMDIFISLVSSDYLSSNYCMDIELTEAIRRRDTEGLIIVPVIIEPCDWHQTKLGSLLAVPKDGKPVSEWTNTNTAFLDVAKAIRRVVADSEERSEFSGSQVSKGISRKIKVKRSFDSIDKIEFSDKSFSAIRDYFESAASELNEVGDGAVRAKFEIIERNAFSCMVVNRERRNGEVAGITVRLCDGEAAMGDLTYVNQHRAPKGTINGTINVESDDYDLFLQKSNFMNPNSARLTAHQVAEELWEEFIGRAGIQYD